MSRLIATTVAYSVLMRIALFRHIWHNSGRHLRLFQRNQEPHAEVHPSLSSARDTFMDLVNYSLSIALSLMIGLGGFILAYKIFDWLTPGVTFAEQLKADNKSVAIFLAGLFIGLGLLLGNAIK